MVVVIVMGVVLLVGGGGCGDGCGGDGGGECGWWCLWFLVGTLNTPACMNRPRIYTIFVHMLYLYSFVSSLLI